MEPQWIVLLKMLFLKDVKMIMWSFDSTGPSFYDACIAQMDGYLEDKVYGEDYVMFDYITGGEAGVAALAVDVWGTLGSDRFGTMVEDLPIMQGVTTAADFDMLFCEEAGIGTKMHYLRHWATPYGTPYMIGTGATPTIYVAYYGREVIGFITGSMGAAELEILIGDPGKGATITDVENMVHVMLVAFMIIGNVAYWGARLSKEESA
jgi:hypothetical protein